MKKVILIMLLASLWSCRNEQKKETEKQKNQTEQKETKPAFDRKAYKMKGKKIAMSTFKLFKGKIENIGKTEGLPGAIDFCHKNAKKLTDSIGKANNVVMQRTSHKLRNKDNKADADQMAVINNYLESQEMHKELTPLVMKDDEGFVHFYAPIKLKKKCLACHGKPEKDINGKVLESIKKYYPDDKATGFREDEFRGIWDIKFLDKK
jgi:arginine utilization protein RocB